MTIIPTRHLLPLAACAGFAFAAACNSDETQGVDQHTPVSYTVLVDSVPTTPPFAFTAGHAVRVQIKFFNALNHDLDDVEASHFAGLTFTPTSLATVVRDPNHNYRFDVTPEQPGPGTLVVSFGHDAAADETSFPATVVSVAAAP
jgi:hypothetical protein